MTQRLSIGDIRERCGDLLDWKASAIEASEASIAELDEALAWLAGQNDEFDGRRRLLSGTVAEIVDILTADEEDEQRGRI